MKNILISVLLLMVVLITGCRSADEPLPFENEIFYPAQNTVRFTSPEEGDRWVPGSTHSITWEILDAAEQIDILLFKKNDLIQTITTAKRNITSYRWTIDDNIRQSVHYNLRIISRETGKELGRSATFYIKSY